MRRLLTTCVIACLAACGAHRPGRCGDTVGAWSAPVDGLRARLITSGARADRAALQVDLEVEAVAGPRAIHWTGMLDLGYVSFALDEAAGAPVAAALAWGGNGPGGSFSEAVAGRVRHRVANDNARRYAASLERRFVARRAIVDMFGELRRFYRLPLAGKLDVIGRAA